MSETRLVKTTALGGLRPLGLQGQPAIDSHRQIAAVLESRLGPDHAALLARPQRRSDGGIDWFTEAPGPVCRPHELDPADRARVEADLARKLADIGALARDLRVGNSDSARHLGALLEEAVRTAGPDSILAVGGRPLLVLWGFAPEREVPGLAPPPVLPVTPLVERPVIAPPPDGSAPVLATVPAASWSLRDWWRWLLMFLLLSIALLLALRACAPLPPAAADATQTDAGELARAEAHGRALERRLAQLQRERDRAAAACAVPGERTIGGAQPLSPRAAAAEEGNAPVMPPTEIAEAPGAADPAPGRPQAPVLPELPEIAAAPSPAEPPSPEAARPPAACAPARLPAEAPEVALVVDASGSMEEPIGGTSNRLDAAKRAISDLLDGLPNDVDVGLVEFRDCERIRRDRFYSHSERGQLKTQIQSLEPGRGTPLARSVERAGAILSAQVPAVMIVVTDGEDSCGGDPCAAAQEIKRKRPNLVINVIDIGSGGSSPAACLAEITGGKVYKPGSAVEFDRMVGQAGGQPDVRECS